MCLVATRLGKHNNAFLSSREVLPDPAALDCSFKVQLNTVLAPVLEDPVLVVHPAIPG